MSNEQRAVRRYAHPTWSKDGLDADVFVLATDYDTLSTELAEAKAEIEGLTNDIQASQCAEKMTADLLVDAKARIAELEAGIRKWASECGGCNFGEGATGKVEVDGVEQPCDQCADIRALLPKEST